MPAADSTLGGACQIPDHELLRLIGRGSYGEVWLARNIMGTFRAVKIIRRDVFDSDSPFDREFAGIKKFEPISRTHSGFVDILQIGRNQAERCLYYVMEAADDLELGQAIDPDRYVPKTLGKALGRLKRFPVDQCVQMGLALCQALETLHRHGLVHRDIKPSNIVFINGVPKLADIGLVTESNNARSFVGTEGFIPPEGPGSKAADIYSLGKALYEIASGRDRLDFPALPSGLSEFEDGDQFLELNECLIRACRLDPAKRYSSAREMYEDLALLASGKSLRRLRVLERRWENAKRVVAVCAGVALLAGIVIFPIARERRHADELRERQIGVRSANGINKLDQGDLAGALGEFAEVFQLQLRDPRFFTANQTRVASILANTPRLTQMLFLESRVSSIQFSSDGKNVLTVEKFKQAAIHDVASGRKVAALQAPGVVYAAFSPDDSRVIIADEDGWATLWDLKANQTQRLPHPAGVMSAAFSPSGKLIATACADGALRIWDASNHTKVATGKGHTNTIRSVAFSPDERFVVTGSTDFTARVWNAATGEQVGSPLQHRSWVHCVTFSPDSSTVATSDNDGWARLWRLSTGEQLPTLMKHDDVASRVAFSPDGQTILTASNDGTVKFWDARTTMPVSRNQVIRHSSGLFAATFHPAGHQFASGAADGTVRVWDLAGSEVEPQPLNGVINSTGTTIAVSAGDRAYVSQASGHGPTNEIAFSGEVRALTLSADASKLAALIASSRDQSVVRVVSVLTNGPETEINAQIAGPAALKLSGDGSLLAIRTANDGTSLHRFFDVTSNAEWSVPTALRKNATFAFHPKKRRVAIAAGASVAIFQDLNEAPLFPQISAKGIVRHVAFSPDGALLLVSQSDDSISPHSALLFDANTGKPIRADFWHRDGVLVGAFQPGGSRIVTGGEDRDVLIWNRHSPNEFRAALVHRHQIKALSFSPNGNWIGSASADGVVRIWDAVTALPITPPLACEKTQSEIVFLADGARFATLQSPTRTWLWTLPKTEIKPSDAIALSHLLNSDLRTVGQPDTGAIAKIWVDLTTRFPHLFRTNPEHVRQWHDRQFRAAKANNAAQAMAFHRNRLDALESVTNDLAGTLATKSK